MRVVWWSGWCSGALTHCGLGWGSLCVLVSGAGGAAPSGPCGVSGLGWGASRRGRGGQQEAGGGRGGGVGGMRVNDEHTHMYTHGFHG